MATQHVVVDGSNIATEGRQMPSLAQLESALKELRKDFPESEVTVVVDATFAHRIDPSEVPRYEAAALRGELVYPPAGAIGRGDAFLLRIAQKVDGTVLSNDSFQEFHGEHPWLFERGRLIGATPVPGVGWIFVPRTPVRGPKSRVATRDASRAKKQVTEAIAEATREVEHPEAEVESTEPTGEKSRRSRTRTPAQKPQAVNDPITFITFIAEHKLGDEIEAEVESFTSHGAVVMYGDVRLYAPLQNLADPPPRSAREVLQRGVPHRFVITALDPYRRGIELSLPGVGHVSGRPTDETVEAEVRLSRRGRRTPSAPAETTVAEGAATAGATDATAESGTPATPRRRGRGRGAKAEETVQPPASEPAAPKRSRRAAKPAASATVATPEKTSTRSNGRAAAAKPEAASATAPRTRAKPAASSATKKASTATAGKPRSPKVVAVTDGAKADAPTKAQPRRRPAAAAKKVVASAKAAPRRRPSKPKSDPVASA